MPSRYPSIANEREERRSFFSLFRSRNEDGRNEMGEKEASTRGSGPRTHNYTLAHRKSERERERDLLNTFQGVPSVVRAERRNFVV